MERWWILCSCLVAATAACGAEDTQGPVLRPEEREETPTRREPAPAEEAMAAEAWVEAEAAVESVPRPQRPQTRYARLTPPTHSDLPEGAPSFVVHTPEGFDPKRPFAIVVFLHGWTGCVRALMEGDRVPCTEGDAPREGWGLGRVHDAANTNTLFVVPQLRYLARSGAAGRYRDPTTFRALLETALRLAHDGNVDEAPSPDQAKSIVLVAHSAGFETALAILEAGDLHERIDGVLLLDALYRGAEGFAHWVGSRDGRRVLSLYTGNQSTYQESRRLGRLARSLLGDAAVVVGPDDLDEAIRERRRVLVASTTIPHGAIPRLSLPALLEAWGLPPRALTPSGEP